MRCLGKTCSWVCTYLSGLAMRRNDIIASMAALFKCSLHKCLVQTSL